MRRVLLSAAAAVLLILTSGRPSPEAPQRTKGTTRKRRAGEPPARSGVDPSPRGQRIRYEEVPFEAGSTAHSRLISGVVQANTLHPDFQQAARSADARLAYAALLIGKESIAFNDGTGAAGDFLEKLLDFYFKLNAHTPKRGRRRVPARPEQDTLDLGLEQRQPDHSARA